MRVTRTVTLAAVAALLGAGILACSTTVAGRGTLAVGGTTPSSPTDSSSTSTDDSTGEPTDDPTDPTESPTPSPTPSPTQDPLKTKEQVTCVLIQASVKTTNDRFNAAKTRDAQLSVLRSGQSTMTAALQRSRLPASDNIQRLGSAIVQELRKLISAANRGATPSTTPYNQATTRFRTACVNL